MYTIISVEILFFQYGPTFEQKKKREATLVSFPTKLWARCFVLLQMADVIGLLDTRHIFITQVRSSSGAHALKTKSP